MVTASMWELQVEKALYLPSAERILRMAEIMNM
jgi:hypothetical protein